MALVFGQSQEGSSIVAMEESSWMVQKASTHALCLIVMDVAVVEGRIATIHADATSLQAHKQAIQRGVERGGCGVRVARASQPGGRAAAIKMVPSSDGGPAPAASPAARESSDHVSGRRGAGVGRVAARTVLAPDVAVLSWMLQLVNVIE